MSHSAREDFDVIVVGSGAGGGPVAANLARAGLRVLVLEAGGDAENYHYQVPCFHGLATEDEEYSWDFFVRHYSSDERQRADSKHDPARGGVFYPRAGTLGGCTAHNAMITVCPHNRDWDDIADATGDESWRSDRMRTYFERLERNRYRRPPLDPDRHRILAAIAKVFPLLNQLFRNEERHGFTGWLTTEMADPFLIKRDWPLLNVVLSAARQAFPRTLTAAEDLVVGDIKAYADPNNWEAEGSEGLWLIPLATRHGKRIGTRERLLETARALPANLIIRTNALVTRVLFEGTRAVGVEYVEQPHAYAADPRHTKPPSAPPKQAFASREVVLSGGSFNTPQLLKLSGVGPADELAGFGIPVVVDLPGVGEGLQDRYEVGVVSEMDDDIALLDGATFQAPVESQPPDRFFEEWSRGQGIYCTNGALLGITKKSRPELELPDLFVFGLPARFRGYYKGYSKELSQHRDTFTWAVLKAHTKNRAGWVRLRSADPCDVPEINFRYFEEGSDNAGEDLEAVVDGVFFARKLMELASWSVRGEIVPGGDVKSRDDVRDFVRREAWGHHACGTCRIGLRSDPMAVVDSSFRVHGTNGLRVVDASVFPKIPGFFIVTPVYMVSEKASDVILADVPQMAKVAGRTKATAAVASAAVRDRVRARLDRKEAE